MYITIIVLLMITSVRPLPRADAKPGLTMDKRIILNIAGVEFQGNKLFELNEGSNGLVQNMEIEINLNNSKFIGNNIISLNNNIGSNIESDTSFQITATPSEDTTLVIAETSAVTTTERPATTPGIVETTVATTTKLPVKSSETTTTTAAATTTTTKPVPAGFERFHGRIVRKTISSDPQYRNNYNGAMSFCDRYGAKPFAAQSAAARQLYEEVRISLSAYMWIPANDRQEEGVLRWENGELWSDLSGWNWAHGEVMRGNADGNDCIMYGGGTDGITPPLIHFTGCNSFNCYPPICEIL